MRVTFKAKAASAVVAAALFVAVISQARHLVIDDVEVYDDPACSIIRVSMNFPVRYINHFPYSEGDDLRIKIEPIVTTPAEREALFTREKVIPPPSDISGLVEVAYEGDVDGGPFITLIFRKKVSFTVTPGEDYRSMVISVAGPEGGPCPPKKEQ